MSLADERCNVSVGGRELVNEGIGKGRKGVDTCCLVWVRKIWGGICQGGIGKGLEGIRKGR